MTKKYFSLIHGDIISIAPSGKVVPAEAFSTLIDADELKKKSLEDAEKFREELAQEADEVREKARQEGFEAGMKEWADHIARLEQEIEAVHEELTNLIVPVALSAAKKVIGEELKVSKDAIVDIVAANLKAVSHHKMVRIYVHPDDSKIVEKNKENLKAGMEELESFTVVEKEDIQQGGCVIETDGGIINAQIDHVLKRLEEAFSQ